MTFRRQYVKLCDVRDFDDPRFLDAVRSLLPEREPRALVERKVWEFAMLVLFMTETGLLHEGTEALSVGAGNERILFWLANRIGRIVATDIYGKGHFADGEAIISMLDNPAAHAPFPYRQDRLDVQWMDARQLSFDDEAFDLVFSISSVEHFGSKRDIATAVSEMARVVKPGGYAVIVTDCLVRFHPLDLLPVGLLRTILTLGRNGTQAHPLRRAAVADVFRPAQLVSQIVRPSGLTLVQPLQTMIDPANWENITRPRRDGRLETSSGRPYPRILIQGGRSIFTSACLVLMKPPVA